MTSLFNAVQDAINYLEGAPLYSPDTRDELNGLLRYVQEILPAHDTDAKREQMERDCRITCKFCRGESESHGPAIFIEIVSIGGHRSKDWVHPVVAKTDGSLVFCEAKHIRLDWAKDHGGIR